jgi:hypothetical protein
MKRAKYEASMTSRGLAKRQFPDVACAHDAGRVYFREFPKARPTPRPESANCVSLFFGNLPTPDWQPANPGSFDRRLQM